MNNRLVKNNEMNCTCLAEEAFLQEGSVSDPGECHCHAEEAYLEECNDSRDLQEKEV